MLEGRRFKGSQEFKYSREELLGTFSPPGAHSVVAGNGLAVRKINETPVEWLSVEKFAIAL